MKKGNKLLIPALNEKLEGGKYLFEVDIFGSNIEPRKIRAEITLKGRKLKGIEV